uniref:Uncharacterized protein n=1 Tax=Fundulus heteroclitus TaxID=8078 RepID=A0A3Q2QP44_FUNHE
MMSDLLTVNRLLLPVQRLLQHQLREFGTVALCLHVEVKIVIVGYSIRAECICANVGVEGVLHRETRPRYGTLRYFHGNVRFREAGRIVVDIHHLDLHAEELQWVLQKHLQVQQARDGLPTDFFPVYFFLHHQRAVLQVYLQVRCPRTWHRLEAASGKLLLFWHGVVQLT